LLHLNLACHLFIEAMFERAGDYFVRGKVDPRLLVRAFPAFRGKLIGSAEEVEVYEGLREIPLYHHPARADSFDQFHPASRGTTALTCSPILRARQRRRSSGTQ
jgi:hypothetical protein